VTLARKLAALAPDPLSFIARADLEAAIAILDTCLAKEAA
jgi:hypothetical protein